MEYDELFHLLFVYYFRQRQGMECEHVWHFWEYKESVAVVWHDRQNIEIAGK